MAGFENHLADDSHRIDGDRREVIFSRWITGRQVMASAMCKD
jgi:hypothetical protein